MVSNPTLLTDGFTNFFLKSVCELTELLPPSDFTLRPFDPAQLVFNIGSLKSSKTKDVCGLKNTLQFYGKSLIQTKSCSHPIFKSGESSNVAVYQPISILPVVSKVDEKRVGKITNEH